MYTPIKLFLTQPYVRFTVLSARIRVFPFLFFFWKSSTNVNDTEKTLCTHTDGECDAAHAFSTHQKLRREGDGFERVYNNDRSSFRMTFAHLQQHTDVYRYTTEAVSKRHDEDNATATLLGLKFIFLFCF